MSIPKHVQNAFLVLLVRVEYTLDELTMPQTRVALSAENLFDWRPGG